MIRGGWLRSATAGGALAAALAMTVPGQAQTTGAAEAVPAGPAATGPAQTAAGSGPADDTAARL